MEKYFNCYLLLNVVDKITVETKRLILIMLECVSGQNSVPLLSYRAVLTKVTPVNSRTECWNI